MRGLGQRRKKENQSHRFPKLPKPPNPGGAPIARKKGALPILREGAHAVYSVAESADGYCSGITSMYPRKYAYKITASVPFTTPSRFTSASVLRAVRYGEMLRK